MKYKVLLFLSKLKGYKNMDIDKTQYKVFNSKEEAKNWGELHYKDWKEQYNSILSEMKYDDNKVCYHDAIEFYCGYTYRDINKYLRNNKNDTSESKYIREYTDMLMLILYLSPRIEENIVLYRLVSEKFIEELLKNDIKGTPATESGFVSTSLFTGITKIKGESYSNCNNLLKIYAEKGNVGLYTPIFAGRSEAEMLLPPNARFYLISKPYYDKELRKTVYECKIEYFGDVNRKHLLL